MRVTLSTGMGRVAHFFLVLGNQGAEEDPDKLLLTNKLLQAVLAEAQVVCVGWPLLVAGDLNAKPCVKPCLAKGFSSGIFCGFGTGLLPWGGKEARCHLQVQA